MFEAIWPGFPLSEARLNISNAEQRRSHSLAFGICEENKASIHKLVNPKVVLKGPVM